jgi:hypothetical protein
MRRSISILVLAIALIVKAQAQDMSIELIGHAHGKVSGVAHQGTRDVVGARVDLIAVEPFEGGRAVTGAPYSAEEITETTQVLSDGNRIEHRTSATVARDRQGRVRREQRALALGALMAEAPAPIITISDPVARVFITLDTARKVAVRSKLPPSGLTRPTRTIGAPGSGTGVGMFRNQGDDETSHVKEVARSDARAESLGVREIEGLQAEGTRTTTTIAAGAMGNQLPIEVVSERWYSPELQVPVVTRRSDPRFGEIVYRLSDIVRDEPLPDLFLIPADYRIEEPPEIRRKP